MKFPLPDTVRCVAEARNLLRKQYASAKLNFTPDGKFVGDLGEAIAAEVFGITLKQGRHIDGYSPSGKPVQIKATGRPDGGIYFRESDFEDSNNVHLIAICIDWDACEAEVIYNGLEKDVRPEFKPNDPQKMVTRNKLLKRNAEVSESERLQPATIYLKG